MSISKLNTKCRKSQRSPGSPKIADKDPIIISKQMSFHQPQNSSKPTNSKIFGILESTFLMFGIFFLVCLANILITWKLSNTSSTSVTFYTCYIIGLTMISLLLSFTFIALLLRSYIRKMILKSVKRVKILQQICKKTQLVFIGYQLIVGVFLMGESSSDSEKLIILYYSFSYFKILIGTKQDFLDLTIIIIVDTIF